MRHRWTTAAVLCLVGTLAGCPPPPAGPPEQAALALKQAPLGQWVPLFDGKSLSSWRVPEQFEFANHGKIEVNKGILHLAQGMPFSAIAWAGDFPKENFEVEVEALRAKGHDIFCGMTFPVGQGHVSFVCGGWGDTVVGISCVDGMSASENETTVIRSFDNDTWYTFRARVTEWAIEGWIDDEKVVEIERRGHEFSLYGGVEPTAPFGIFTWQTAAKLRSIRFRRLRGTPKAPPKQLPELPEGPWRSLFNGRDLGGWGVAERGDFALHGKVTVSDGELRLAAGDPLTGVGWNREFPTTDYEIVVDALREEGQDFFCGLTFPVGKTHCTLVVGGWRGNVVGLSNVDDLHAAENETSTIVHFRTGEWYRIRLRVTDAKIQAWIDGKPVIELARKGRRLTIWPQQKPMKPLGLSTYYTTARLRNIQYRTLGGD
ncbi:MAG: 3-keto-disaccharide hydrolase [Planctomycetota bacterium]